jgi:hypothetical protein
MKLAESKRELTSYKNCKGMAITIGYEDVVPLINKVWPVSFGRIESNKKEIRNGGWFPPNRNLLLHPEIQEEKENQRLEYIISKNQWIGQKDTSILPECINTSEGKAGLRLDKIIQHRARTGGIDNHRKSMIEGGNILDDLNKGRRLTSGFIVSRGIHSLNHPSLLQLIRNKKEKKRRKLA